MSRPLVTGGPTAGQEAGEGGDAAAEHEARDRGADHHLALVLTQLGAPVGGLDDLAAQLLHRDRQVGAVGLDGTPDLVRGALAAHRASTSDADGAATAPDGVAGCGDV